MGFSGTKDRQLLLPLQVRGFDTEAEALAGTDGRMLRLFLDSARCYELEPAAPGAARGGAGDMPAAVGALVGFVET